MEGEGVNDQPPAPEVPAPEPTAAESVAPEIVQPEGLLDRAKALLGGLVTGSPDPDPQGAPDEVASPDLSDHIAEPAGPKRPIGVQRLISVIRSCAASPIMCPPWPDDSVVPVLHPGLEPKLIGYAGETALLAPRDVTYVPKLIADAAVGNDNHGGNGTLFGLRRLFGPEERFLRTQRKEVKMIGGVPRVVYVPDDPELVKDRAEGLILQNAEIVKEAHEAHLAHARANHLAEPDGPVEF